MKKILTIALLIIMFVSLGTCMVKATTQSELESYLLSAHTISAGTVSLTEADKSKVRKYLAENKITDEQATAIKAQVDAALNLMDKAGVTDVKNLSTEKKKEIFSIAQNAASQVGLTLVLKSNDGTVEIYKDGVIYDSVTTDPTKLVQTGYSNVKYLVLAGVAIIAVATVATVEKRTKAIA